MTATKRWMMPTKYIPNPVDIQHLKIPKTMQEIMTNRGHQSSDQVVDFLKPSLFSLHQPNLFREMPKAILRLIQAQAQQEKVLLYGDYDADGVTGTALIYHVLRRFDFNIVVYIPTREEGYGLHQEVFEKAYRNEVKVIITVDCGITANEEILYAKQQGMDVIITDHHEAPEILPPAWATLNPKVRDSGYPFPFLSGVGVVYKLIQAIYAAFQYPIDKVGTEADFLDLVALGTIADLVPLVEENRILVKFGLLVMAQSNNIGLRALVAECGLSGKKIKAGQVSFMLAPRINAAGRMDTAHLALNLLISDNEEEAVTIAKELSEENHRRQISEKKILLEAENMLQKEKLPEVIVLSSKTWSHGIIGIVASRLVERFKRPVYLISEEGQTGKGSARGVPHYHVLGELIKLEHYLTKYGGHKQAAGFSLDLKNIDPFRQGLTKSFLESNIPEGEEVEIDAVVPVEEINFSLHKLLEEMGPFGMGNPSPLLLTEGLKVKRVFAIGKDSEHLKFILERNGLLLEALAFKKGYEYDNVKGMDTIDILYSLEKNEYLGEVKIQLVIKDFRPSLNVAMAEVACSSDHKENLKSIKTESSYNHNRSNQVLMSRTMLVGLYQKLKSVKEENNTVSWDTHDAPINIEMIKVLEELEIVSWMGGTGPYLIRINEVGKKDLTNSLRYRRMSQSGF